MRRGFTLLEMLVAAGIFVTGFALAIGLFLAGMRYRKLSDDLVRGSFAATSIIEEIRLDAGGDKAPDASPFPPEAYAGDGKAQNGIEVAGALQRYRAMPGIWFRVIKATDLQATGVNPDPAKAKNTTAIHCSLIVLSFGTNDEELTIPDLVRRLRLRNVPTGNSSEDIDAQVDELVNRGIAQRYEAVIVRRPSWLPPEL